MTSGLISSATGPWWRRSSAGCGITATPCTSKARRCASRKVEEETVENHPIGREEYIHQVLRAYRQTPGTTGTIRSPDRLLAAQLYARGVPLRAVENALVLAASRRLLRPTQAPPLSTIRSPASLPRHPTRRRAVDATDSILPVAPRLRRGSTPSAWAGVSTFSPGDVSIHSSPASIFRRSVFALFS